VGCASRVRDAESLRASFYILRLGKVQYLGLWGMLLYPSRGRVHHHSSTSSSASRTSTEAPPIGLAAVYTAPMNQAESPKSPIGDAGPEECVLNLE
jgi:hypothetical protein